MSIYSVPLDATTKHITLAKEDAQVSEYEEAAEGLHGALGRCLEYKVVHEEPVALRMKPSFRAIRVGQLQRGDIMQGIPAGPWLRVMETQGPPLPAGGAWAFVGGPRWGQGTLLQPKWAAVSVSGAHRGRLRISWPGLEKVPDVAYYLQWLPEGGSEQNDGRTAVVMGSSLGGGRPWSLLPVLDYPPQSVLKVRVVARLADGVLVGPWSNFKTLTEDEVRHLELEAEEVLRSETEEEEAELPGYSKEEVAIAGAAVEAALREAVVSAVAAVAAGSSSAETADDKSSSRFSAELYTAASIGANDVLEKLVRLGELLPRVDETGTATLVADSQAPPPAPEPRIATFTDQGPSISVTVRAGSLLKDPEALQRTRGELTQLISTRAGNLARVEDEKRQFAVTVETVARAREEGRKEMHPIRRATRAHGGTSELVKELLATKVVAPPPEQNKEEDEEEEDQNDSRGDLGIFSDATAGYEAGGAGVANRILADCIVAICEAREAGR